MIAYSPSADWPPVHRQPFDLARYAAAPELGCDLEWDRQQRPDVLGLSDGQTTISVSWDSGKEFFADCLRRRTHLIGHNFIAADMLILADLGLPMHLADIDDTIIQWWLTNMHLCKAVQKTGMQNDEGERRGRGFMNLWTMASVCTSLPDWKDCRTKAFCNGPCPTHDFYGYNAIDAFAPIAAQPALRTRIKLLGLSALYDLHKELAYYLALMRRFGVRVDTKYLKTLKADFVRAKQQLADSLPFNPASPQQVARHFRDKGIPLDDAQEETIREACEDHPGDAELARLLEWKEIGNGPDRWFGERYLDDEGYIHPSLGFFTSSGRLNCVDPNLQNVGKRRVDRTTGQNIGKRVRRAIIAPDGYYIIRADLSNGENRVYLHLAGYEAPSTDLHAWMVQNIGLKPDDEFSKRLGSPRDAAKSVTHASDYMEGLQLREPSDLRSRRVQSEIAAGARMVFPDWKFNGKVVTFTGINLAERAFGSATFDNRRQALAIASRYLDQSFPKVRDLQRRIMAECERDSYVKPPTGYVTLSYGKDEDRIKAAAAIWGSQPVAHITKLALITLWRDFLAGRSPVRPVLQVHDEIIGYVPNEVPSPVAARALVESLQPAMNEMPGFKIPAEPSCGPSWAEQTKL